jgi:hypothetical protein
MSTSTEIQRSESQAPLETVRSSAATAIEFSRAAQEVIASIKAAKADPRATISAHRRIVESCKRYSLAEQAMYAYPRGGETVRGASIRLAEVLAQNWGNIDSGIVELERQPGASVLMAYCTDLEANYKKRIVFTVPHMRDTKKGLIPLKTDRDIYENNANMGARRLRNCILAIIPGDVVESAVQQCYKTLEQGDGSKPLVQRLRELADAFEKIGVPQSLLEERLGHPLDKSIPAEIADLRTVYISLRDGVSEKADWFESVAQAAKASSVSERSKEPEATSAPLPFEGKPVPPLPEAEEGFLKDVPGVAPAEEPKKKK